MYEERGEPKGASYSVDAGRVTDAIFERAPPGRVIRIFQYLANAVLEAQPGNNRLYLIGEAPPSARDATEVFLRAVANLPPVPGLMPANWRSAVRFPNPPLADPFAYENGTPAGTNLVVDVERVRAAFVAKYPVGNPAQFDGTIWAWIETAAGEDAGRKPGL